MAIDFDRLIADRAHSVDASGIRRVFDLGATATNPINLSIGQPHFDVPDQVKAAAIAAITDGRNTYTPTQGLADLTERVSRDFDERFKADGRWEDRGSMVTAGVSGGLMLGMMACVDPDDEVLLPDPYFVMYKQLTRMLGARGVFVDTYPDFRLTAARIEPLFTPRTKLLIASSPSNPTGVVLDEREWADLVQLCEERGVLLISDEIYEQFCYEPVDTPVGPRCPSPAAAGDQMLVLRGFGKTFGMTGWRLGYAMGPRLILDQMKKLQQYTFVCAPSMAQWAGLAAMDIDMSGYVAEYESKRDRVVDKLSAHFHLTVPSGAFYAFPGAPTGTTGTRFVEAAIARGLLIIPGNIFSERDTHFRISYACDDNTLDRGLDLLVELAQSCGRPATTAHRAG